MKKSPATVVALARQQLGYLEKKSNACLDEASANAGSGNFTKYARDLDNIPGFYNGKKNGYPWCDVFVDWLFVTCFGAETAKEMLCQPGYSYGAGCGYSARYYKAQGRFLAPGEDAPRPGDQIFFRNFAHTGLVVAVDDTFVTTIEGNTSTKAGVVANGGGVWEKRYRLLDQAIDGYGRPKYDAEGESEDVAAPEASTGQEAVVPESGTMEENREGYTLEMRILKMGCKGEDVRALQILLMGRGYGCGQAGADGDFGSRTSDAVKRYQGDHSLTQDAIAGPATLGSLMGAAQ